MADLLAPLEPPAAEILARAETTMVEEHLCLWFLCPGQLKGLLVLTLAEGTATPVPMDCLHVCSDLWTPDLRDCVLRGRGRIDASIVLEVAWLCPDLSSLDIHESKVTDRTLMKVAPACPTVSTQCGGHHLVFNRRGDQSHRWIMSRAHIT